MLRFRTALGQLALPDCLSDPFPFLLACSFLLGQAQQIHQHHLRHDCAHQLFHHHDWVHRVQVLRHGHLDFRHHLDVAAQARMNAWDWQTWNPRRSSFHASCAKINMFKSLHIKKLTTGAFPSVGAFLSSESLPSVRLIGTKFVEREIGCRTLNCGSSILLWSLYSCKVRLGSSGFSSSLVSSRLVHSSFPASAVSLASVALS